MQGQKCKEANHGILWSTVWSHQYCGVLKKVTKHCRMHQPTAWQRKPAHHDWNGLYFSHVTVQLRCSFKRKCTGYAWAFSTWSPAPKRSSYPLLEKPHSASFDRFPMFYFLKNKKYAGSDFFSHTVRRLIYLAPATLSLIMGCNLTTEVNCDDSRRNLESMVLRWLSLHTPLKCSNL